MADPLKLVSPLAGQHLAIDPRSQSASTTQPAFIARPTGAPVYHGFQVLDDVVVEGFTLGKITDFEVQPSTYGDAFVIAPDGSRAGLVWEVAEIAYFHEVCCCEPNRWGVWGLSFPFPRDSRENARRNLEFVLPQLRQKWEEWRRTVGSSSLRSSE
jgi:hypothetical protein